jgi:P27 family predicted phage terminase small subunit
MAGKGQGGRKRKPDQFKVLEGTFRKDRANPDTPASDKKGMEAPPWLPADCLEHFLTVKERISVYKLDSASWTEAAALIAMRINEIEVCNRVIEQEGRTYKSETGSETIIDPKTGEAKTLIKVMVKGHPIVAQKNEAMRHLQSLLSDFGLTPSAIGKVGSSGEGKKGSDPWGEF